MKIKQCIKGLIGLLGMAVILYILPQVAVGLASDNWTIEGRDAQTNREWEQARDICTGSVVIAIPVSVWAFYMGRNR